LVGVPVAATVWVVLRHGSFAVKVEASVAWSALLLAQGGC
jgi:hypothetical protein